MDQIAAWTWAIGSIITTLVMAPLVGEIKHHIKYRFDTKIAISIAFLSLFVTIALITFGFASGYWQISAGAIVNLIVGHASRRSYTASEKKQAQTDGL